MGAQVRAAQYVRMSTEHQRYSLANQAAIIAVYAAQHGYEVLRTYADAGKSGLQLKGRKGLQQLLSDALSENRDFDAILVLDVSRWGRFQDTDQSAHYEYICREAGVQIVYCAESFMNEVGVATAILKNLKRVMAGEYSRELSEKVRFSRRRRALAGQMAGKIPYGFRRCGRGADGVAGRALEPGERRRVGEEPVLVHGPPEEIATIRRIFRLYLIEHLSLERIAADLNRRGVAWKAGATWTGERVRGVVNSELVIGQMVFNKSRTRLGAEAEIIPKEDWLRVRVLRPIVSPKVFYAAQERSRRLGGPRRRTDEEMLDDLRGLVSAHQRLSSELIDASTKTLNTAAYRDRFGSLREAYKLIGHPDPWPLRPRYTKRGAFTREAIIRQMRRLQRRVGDVTLRDLQSDPRLPSTTTIRSRFGTMAKAFEMAGLKRSAPSLVWEAWAANRPGANTG